jgi:hypothetical protein
MQLSYCALKRDGTTLTAKGSFESVRELMDNWHPRTSPW